MEDTTDKGIFSLFSKTNKDQSENDSKKIIKAPKTAAIKSVNVSIRTTETHYNTNNAHIGHAIIFNHARIDGQTNRTGTEKDKNRIEKVLQNYGFDVKVCNDYTFENIDKILGEYSQKDHSNNDCLVVVVMSHGLAGKVFAADMPYPIERLWKPFLGENCKTLINKPKLFFIQACRGEKLESGVQFESRRAFRTMSRAQSVMEIEPVVYTIPATADLLVFYSTYEEHYSWRNPANGSWFIQTLSAVLEEAAEGDKPQELFHLLTAVNRRVAYEYQSNVPKNENLDEMKQMPNFVSTLTKIFLMKPKIGALE